MRGQLAAFRGQRLTSALLRRRGLPLALAAIDLPEDAAVVDLDDPAVLRRERVRPSGVGSRHRELTQPQALRLYRKYPKAAGLRWWSMWEAQWINLTVFDRAAARLRLHDVAELTLDHPAVSEAADVFGLRVVRSVS